MAKRKIYQKGYQYHYYRNLPSNFSGAVQSCSQNQSGNNNTGNIFFVANASVANFFDANLSTLDLSTFFC